MRPRECWKPVLQIFKLHLPWRRRVLRRGRHHPGPLGGKVSAKIEHSKQPGVLTKCLDVLDEGRDGYRRGRAEPLAALTRSVADDEDDVAEGAVVPGPGMGG